MSVQRVQDNGAVNGSLDLKDQVTVSSNGENVTITIENYLTANSRYDSSELPNERLAHVLRQAKRLPIDVSITNFVNDQTKSWNQSHPVVSNGDSKPDQCPQGTTLVTASGFVTDNFCVDNEATQKVGDQNPTWYEARDFCEAAGKFLLTYEQHKLAAKSTNSSVVKSSGDFEWVLKSNGNESLGQFGGFFVVDHYRGLYDEVLGHDDPDIRSIVAFRCGVFPSSQDSKK